MSVKGSSGKSGDKALRRHDARGAKTALTYWRYLSRTIWNRPYVVYPLSFLFGAIVWELVARQLPGVIFAPPTAVLAHFIGATVSGELPSLFVNSLAHMTIGYVLGVAVAIPIGFWMGRSETAFHMFDPIVNALYSIPTIAFVPFLIVWFGLFLEGRAALVFVMVVFDVIVTVSAGARNIEPGYVNVARSFGASRRDLFFKVMIPASLPFVFTGLRIGIVRAVNGMITAELFFAAVNLGKYMIDAASAFDSAALLTVILLLALFGLALQEFILWLEPRLLPWHVRR